MLGLMDNNAFGHEGFTRLMRLRSVASVFLVFLLFGGIMGLLAVYSWTTRSGETLPLLILFNAPGILLGDELYVRSIDLLGEPSSEHAHFTIPWVLRVPQVYVISSMLSWGLVGLLAGLLTSLTGHR
jgi:hypothetical protein